MKITLRKAKAIQNYINDAIVPVVFTGTIENYAVVSDKLTTMRKEVIENTARNEKLYDALYNIREQLAGANHLYGVDKILALVNKCTKLSNLYNTNNAVKAEPTDVYSKRLKKIEESEDPYTNTVQVSTLTDDIYTEFANKKVDIDRLKISLQDELSHINNTNYITLQEDIVDTLKLFKII